MSKASVFAMIILICFAIGAALVNHNLEAARERPSVQRLDSYNRLKRLASSFRSYLNSHHGQWPEHWSDFLHDQRLGLGVNLVKGGGLYLYRKPPADALADYIIMWSDTNHAVIPKGQQWGSSGQIAAQDIPGVAFVLNASLQVEELTLEEFAKRSPTIVGASARWAPVPLVQSPPASSLAAPVPPAPTQTDHVPAAPAAPAAEPGPSPSTAVPAPSAAPAAH
jgi:hypothetical protein